MFSFIFMDSFMRKLAFACIVTMFHEVWVITETLASLTDRRDMTLSNKWWKWRKINQPTTHHVQWPLACVRYWFHFSLCIWHFRTMLTVHVCLYKYVHNLRFTNEICVNILKTTNYCELLISHSLLYLYVQLLAFILVTQLYLTCTLAIELLLVFILVT